MASSSRGGTWRYNAFTSFHGPDVRKTFLSHLRKQLSYKGITMFDDEKIERSEVIGPALTQAIRESRISIVVLSKQYASSSWCLDELLEIMKCKEELELIVMTVFYEVEPSDVRKQNGEFGTAFNKTCAEKTEEKIGKWRKALTDVSNIAGEDFQAWKNEAEMIEKIASDISNKLNATPSRDFDGMVGFEAHMKEMESRLDFDNNDVVKIVAISGPAGIGKTTIARALHSLHSNNFHLNCFIDNLRGYDEYALREQLLSKVLNLNGIRICHSGLIQERLHDQKVLIVLDDVQCLNQLEALADIRVYGPGSRIIVTTEDKEILHQHGINDIYHVSFPSKAEALMIFCLSAFRQTSPPDGFLYLANEVVSICGNLPLGLKVLGSSLKGKSLDDWELELPRLKDSLDGKIESVLRVGYESLNERDQLIFLCTAIFFNGERVDDVTSMLDVTKLNAKLGLKILANRYLIQHVGGVVDMHHLLQQMARQVISRQEFPKRQILVNPHEISYVLEKAKGNVSVVGISLDMTEVKKLIMSTKAFEKMFNLLFLKVYNVRWRFPILPQLHIPEEMEFPPRLRLLHWEDYPRKSLPLGFCTENFVKLDMRYSLLEKLWEGNQPLVNLKEMNFSCSAHLKEIPDLSTATNLEILDLYGCSALVEIPSLISNFHKLSKLLMDGCKSLEVIPTLANMTSLEGYISMKNCLKLRVCPDIPTNTKFLTMKNTAVEELPASLTHCSSLRYVDICGSRNLKALLTHLPTSVYQLDLSNSGIERINTDCIQGLHNLHSLYLSNCKRLVSLPKLPSSLEHLMAVNCESLERVSEPLDTPKAELNFTNCFKLSGPHARQAIIRQSFLPNFKWGSYFGGSASLPGREVPEEFVHRTTTSSLTIPPSTFNRIKGCILVSPKSFQDIFSKGGHESDSIYFDCKINGNLVQTVRISCIIQAEHLLIFGSDFLSVDPSKVSTKIELQCSVYLEVNNDVFEYPLDKVEWGIQILTDENEVSKNGGSGNYSMDTLEFYEVRGEEDAEEGSKSESGQASKDKDECIVDAYESVSRKRLKEKTITSSDTNVFLQEMTIQETGQCSSLEGLAKGGDYKLLSRKRPKKTTFISSTTTWKRVIQRRRTKKKKSKLNYKLFQWSRSFRIALLLRSRRKPAHRNINGWCKASYDSTGERDWGSVIVEVASSNVTSSSRPYVEPWYRNSGKVMAMEEKPQVARYPYPVMSYSNVDGGDSLYKHVIFG